MYINSQWYATKYYVRKNREWIEEFTEGNIFTVKDTVHKMYNATDSTAITFHVYSPPLKDVQIYE